jgi:hypothetical protein
MLYAISPYSSNWLSLNQASECADFRTPQIKAVTLYLAASNGKLSHS